MTSSKMEQREVGRIICKVLCHGAARLGCKSGMVGTGWANNSCPGCMNRLRKLYFHLAGGSFLAGKPGCLDAEWAVAN